MNKNRFFRSVTATVCAVFCLALLLCITSCFNLSSTLRAMLCEYWGEDYVTYMEQHPEN